MNSKHNKLLENWYTNAPKQRSGLFYASLQLLAWFFFHPSAWRNHIERIAPGTSPDFTLTEMQWHKPEFRRLLLIGYFVCPALTSVIVLVVLLFIDSSNLLMGGICAFTAAFMTAVGLGSIGSIVLGITSGIAFGIASGIVLGSAGFIEGNPTGVLSALASHSPGIYIGTAVSLGCGLASSMSSSKVTFSLPRQIGGVVVGILVGVLMVMALWFAAESIAPELVGFGLEAKMLGMRERIFLGVTIAGVVSLMLIGTGKWQMKKWHRSYLVPALISILYGILYGITNSLGLHLAKSPSTQVATNIFYGLCVGAVFAVWGSGLFVLPSILAIRLGGQWAGAVAGASSCGVGWAVFYIVKNSLSFWPILPVSVIAVILGLTITAWRPWLSYLLQAGWNTIIFNLDEGSKSKHRNLLHRHAAFWDDFQNWRLFGLDEHLVQVMERNLIEGRKAIDYLMANNQQLWAVIEAYVELNARRLARCQNIDEISAVQHHLVLGESKSAVNELLREFQQISQDVAAALELESNYNKRTAMITVEEHLQHFLQGLGLSRERNVRRFLPISESWLKIIAHCISELAKDVVRRGEIESPYLPGKPLPTNHSMFVVRSDIGAHLEELLRQQNSPPILIYGQRRMGKTSLLKNLRRLLPSHILPMYIDLQGRATAAKAKNDAGFLYEIVCAIIESVRVQRNMDVPQISYEKISEDPYLRFNEWIDHVGMELRRYNFLLALDELEELDHALNEKRFDEHALLGMLRHQIQHNPRLKVLMACSHTLEEMPRWYSYLINVQVVKVGYLKEEEAIQLIERPIKDFSLKYEPEATQRVLTLTRRHPALVQQLCKAIVALKNEQPPTNRRLARVEDVEIAASQALIEGQIFFRSIVEYELNKISVNLARFVAGYGENAVVSRKDLSEKYPEDSEDALKLLLRRDLIELVGHGYRFQVELMRRWFADEENFEFEK